MVQIRYGEYSEQADLVGKSVAEAREQYKEEFGIPDKAQARLNGKPVKKKLEADTELGDGDELSFAEKSRSRGLFLMAACLLALAITGGVFAYGYTTAGITLGVVAEEDWVTVIPGPGITWDVFGRAIGELPENQPLFTITTDPGWTGDYEVRVYLANAAELVDAYRYLNMKLMFVDEYADEIGLDRQAREVDPDWQLLTLTNSEVTFLVDAYAPGIPYYVILDGGSFMAHPAAWFGDADVAPQLWIEVTQAGLPRS
ncbi:hypothetical protein M1N58_01160 [Dehalococcoidales bacterium]|nr:hypothetical protein [Dehalococcoidales bacterium]